MSDTKLRPEDLTSEERAIVDNAALFYRRVTGDVGETAEWAYVEALKEAEPIILARRALFAPAPEKAAKAETMADRIAADLKAGTFRGEQPAPPEPAAPVNGSTPVGEYDPDMKPAAREMPEAVRDALSFIRSIDRNWNKTSDQIADALEREWRNLAQPVAVGMTEELRMILDVAESRAEDQRHDGLLECSRNLERAIAAVRQQAAQGRKVELGKVRELVNDLKRALSEAAPSEMTMLDPHEWRSDLDAVFAELDAAEGKRRE